MFIRLDKHKDNQGFCRKHVALKSLITDKQQRTNKRLAVKRELKQQRR